MDSTLTLLLLFLGYCFAVIEGELRCYCNESGCVSTGYMCKSNIGKCYTAMETEGEVTRTRHGCYDNLPESMRTMCGEGEELVEPRDSQSTVTVIFKCCKDDMCNYKEKIIDIPIVQASNSNGSSQKGHTKSNPVGNHVYYSRRDPERDLWFKAAVIAVPIAGGFILILLVLLAVRMLRTDSRRHRRLIQVRRERSLTKAQLYVTDHFSDKSENSCTLFPDKSKPSICRDINIKVDKDGRIYEKVGDKKIHRHSHPSSVIMWGKPSKNDLPTVV
ncbi:BMP and activin membrane-bound inhibitor homolog [Haliotis asinina]|uniref:BMP and activin membrane-bound inhibitor homolog n=1 Tax=Haliotis asinina TaxID=109174 RepID=UPI0035319FBC